MISRGLRLFPGVAQWAGVQHRALYAAGFGAVNDGILRPVPKDANQFSERLKNGLSGAVDFALLAEGGAMVARGGKAVNQGAAWLGNTTNWGGGTLKSFGSSVETGAAWFDKCNRPFVNGMVAGIAGMQVDSLAEGYGLAGLPETAVGALAGGLSNRIFRYDRLINVPNPRHNVTL